jgi:chemotaxis protein methyltransferase CheR
MSELRLTPQAFAILSALVEETSGLSYTLADKEIFESKVCARALDAGFESVLDYYYFLRYDQGARAELDALIEALVVHETFFFRELQPLRVMVGQFVLPLIKSGGRPRIWCAASSTGEEPLTIAMLLAAEGVLDKVELIASDISARVLARARKGEYSPRTLRRAPIPPFATPFMQVSDQGVSVSASLREAVQWRRLNLTNREHVQSVGKVDVILCRNVLIYFRDEVAHRVVEHLTQQLVPGGVLFVGVSESLMRFGTALHCEEHSGAFTYRKLANS